MSNINKYELREPQLEAEIYYLTEQEGGRKTAVNNGYRGQFYYNGKDWDAPQQFIDKETCNLGETVKVYLQTLSTDFHIGQFFVGQEFETREGAKIVGKGKITRIIRPDFNYWDGSTFLKSLDKSIEPYSDATDFLKFRMDLENWLIETEIIKNIEFEMTGDLECMMLIKCKLINKDLQPREVAYKIIECWKTKLTNSNQLYKIEMNTSFNHNKNQSQTDKFVLSFATWHSFFLTGQIIVQR
ncbi:hypothetical protein [Flavobacterium sp. AJR]|uniref:EF-Tu C-terminal domain-related protein n=1 Tax=Flavobacterium sp. AJR TaxID=1979369 RepID=UPI001A98A7E7|nr:hypothetical protein [Flavobacterium sp. AJR]